jgi:aminomethyltransferase
MADPVPPTAEADPTAPPPAPLLLTPLASRHRALGARMAPFAGYDMPVQYPTGILAEHQWTRENAGFFDVSHMGQGFLVGPDHETTARALEALCPADILGMKPGQQRYTQLLNERGGILDDLMVTRPAEEGEEGVLMLVVNASRKDDDWSHIEGRLGPEVRLLRAPQRGLIALQGPKAAEILARHCPGAADLGFMSARATDFDGVPVHVSRSGYTGEDGFEISVRAKRLETVADVLLADPLVKPIGLGARDSLRLEAGLCLYGHDIDETTSPVEAALVWSMQKRRREEGGFPGFERVRRELAEGPPRLRVGLKPEGRAPAREGAEIVAPDGRPVGKVTSGGFGPTVGGPIAMGYVEPAFATVGSSLALMVRGSALPAKVVAMPFVPHRYARKSLAAPA